MMVFSCSECDRSYKDQYDLKDHFEVIHGNKVYQCGDCGRRDFNSRKSFRQHLRQHKMKPGAAQLKSKTNLATAGRGQVDQGGEGASRCRPPEFQCPLCDRGYQRKKRLKDHMDFVHSGKKVECTICHRNDFNSMEYYREHMAKHKKRPNEILRRGAGATPLRNQNQPPATDSEVVVMSPAAVYSDKAWPERKSCSRCPETFSCELERNRHLLRVHFSWKMSHRCQCCFEAVASQAALDEHVRVQHAEGLRDCESVGCEYVADSYHSMNRHYLNEHAPKEAVAVFMEKGCQFGSFLEAK